MTVSTVASNAALIARTLANQSARVSSSAKAIASGALQNSVTGGDASALSISTQLQGAAAGLRATAQNLAQVNALTDTASGAADQITQGLSRLATLATQASSTTLSDGDRAALNTEFQSVQAEINSIANGTRFGGKTLLDGSFNAASTSAGGEGTPTLTLGSLTTASLFGGTTPDVGTQANAQAALTAVASAQTYAAGVVGSIAASSEILQFSAANVASALENQQAAASTLSDADFGASVSESVSATVQSQAALATLVQTNRLKSNTLDLLKE